ncbi:Sirtuin family, catalytic core small domain [Pelomyxa schiedti]|nr:Sirtuin family, catalytic core small domain [Pelomyxa schiedti]
MSSQQPSPPPTTTTSTSSNNAIISTPTTTSPTESQTNDPGLTLLRDQYMRVAELIERSACMVVALGAGAGADGGLKVFKEIADIPAYRALRLQYVDICQPHWIERDPKLFYGFWGSCYNIYKDTPPHEGYQILKEWKRRYFSSPFPERSDDYLAHTYKNKRHCKFICISSNIDCHPQNCDLVLPDELHEIHGNTTTWQCSKVCTRQTWNAPVQFRFKVDMETMVAPEGEPQVSAPGWEDNHPKCPHCGAYARPAILMFGDDSWVAPERNCHLYEWESKTSKYLSEHAPEARLLILEIGCGLRVPSIRGMTASLLDRMSTGGGKCTLVRINPSPKECCDDKRYGAMHDNAELILMQDGCKHALHEIEEILKAKTKASPSTTTNSQPEATPQHTTENEENHS